MSGSLHVELQSEFNGSLAQLLYDANAELLEKQKDEIINILGGINNILQIYVSNKHELLTKTQQDGLIDLISSCSGGGISTFAVESMHHHHQSTLNSASIIIDAKNGVTSQEQQLQQFDIYLHTRDDLYHKIFKKMIADRITEFVLSKLMLFIFLIIFVLITCITIPFQLPMWRFILLILLSVFLVSQLFAFNLAMTRSMLLRFDLLYKLFNCIVIYVCSVSLFREQLQKSNKTTQYDSVDLHFINTLNITTVFLISNHDAWRMPNILKVFIVFAIIGLYVYFWCIVFYSYDFILQVKYQDMLWNVPVLGKNLSLRGLFISSLSTLIIFFVKQEWNMIKDKNKSSVYAIKPNIQWIVDWKQYGNEYYSIKHEILIK